jgi:ribose transport system substrate-binding protein
MRRLRLAPLFWMALVLLLSSCSLPWSGESSQGKTEPELPHVTLVARMQQLDYWKTVRLGAEAAAKEFGVQLEVVSPSSEEDVQGQAELIDRAVAAGVTDVLVLAANDYAGLAPAVERAVSRGIPVINIDAEVKSSLVRSFIGIDNVEAGRQAAVRLVELIGHRGQVAVMSFGAGPRNGEQRRQGVLEALGRYPNVEVVTVEHCTSVGSTCEALTRSWVARYPELRGIVALNAVTSLGAGKELQRLGLGGKIRLVTFDSTPEEVELLQDGVIQATVVQNPFSMGYLGVKHAVDVLNGGKVPAMVDTGTKVIDQQNMFWLENQKLLFPFVQ